LVVALTYAGAVGSNDALSAKAEARAHPLVYIQESARHPWVMVYFRDSTLAWEIPWALVFKTHLMP